jgi:hypothetical protein
MWLVCTAGHPVTPRGDRCPQWDIPGKLIDDLRMQSYDSSPIPDSWVEVPSGSGSRVVSPPPLSTFAGGVMTRVSLQDALVPSPSGNGRELSRLLSSAGKIIRIDRYKTRRSQGFLEYVHSLRYPSTPSLTLILYLKWHGQELQLRCPQGIPWPLGHKW